MISRLPATTRRTLYRDLAAPRSRRSSRASPTEIANMANAAALCGKAFPTSTGRVSIAGRRRARARPVPGPRGCIRIPFGNGRVRRRRGDLAGPARRRRPCVRGPHRLRRGLGERARHPDRSRTALLIAVLDLDSRTSRASMPTMKRAASALAKSLARPARSSSTAPIARRRSEPGMIITMHGNLPASWPVKLVTPGPDRRPERRRGRARQCRCACRHSCAPRRPARPLRRR